MKKLINKLRKRDKPAPSSRITNETVAEHREHILAGGRRFKYPIQYARHKLVFNAIIISVVTLIVITGICWWQLYSVQNTSEFMYRITKVIPVPVAMVDGQPVLYSDYLVKYRSSIHYLEKKEQIDLKTEDGKRQVEYIKQESLKDAIADAYAVKLASEAGITISDKELDEFLKSQRQSSSGEISPQIYDAVIMDYYGWSPDEFRNKIKKELLCQKVSYEMDKDALKLVENVKAEFKKTPTADLKTLSVNLNSQTGSKLVYGASGWVPKSNLDGGLATAATKLKKSEVSSVIKSSIGEGYYFVRLLDINEAQVSYDYIQVPLKAFNESLKDVTDSNKVKKYITI